MRIKNFVGNCENSFDNSKWLILTIQCLIVFSALVLNLLVPIIYGIESFGRFIQINILIFVIQKFTDIIIEPLLATVESKYIFVTAIFTSILVLLIAQIIDYFDSIGSQVLLITMLLSSNCMLAMFAMRLHSLLLIHLVLIQCVFFTLFVCDRYGLLSFTILELLIWTNLAPTLLSIFGLFRLGARFPTFKNIGIAIITSIRQFPINVSLTLVMNCLTNIFPYVLAKQLIPMDVGIFRIVTSILQSATSLFPINTKSIFIILINSKNRSLQMQTLMIFSLLYFSIIGISLTILSTFLKNLTPYFEMITILPIVYWVVLLERYIQAIGVRTELIFTNFIIGSCLVVAVFFVKELRQAEHLYLIGVAVYVCALLAISKLTIMRVNAYIITVCSVLIIFIKDIFPEAILIYMSLLTVITMALIKYNALGMILPKLNK